MANRRWLNETKAKSVVSGYGGLFFIIFLFFFIKRVPVPLSPPVLPPLILHAHTPFALFRSPVFRCVAIALLDASKSSEIGANATEHLFCSIHRLATGSLSCVQHAQKHAKNPVKSTTHALHAHELTNRENP